MTTPLTHVVNGYTQLATSLLDQWSEHMSAVAEHLDDPDYDADRASTDLADCVTLATETGLLLANEALDAIATLGMRRANLAESQPFPAPPGASLAPAGPLDNGFDVLLTVSVEPEQLGAGQSTFKLHANATGYPSATYTGAVIATPPGAVAVPIPVWLVVR